MIAVSSPLVGVRRVFRSQTRRVNRGAVTGAVRLSAGLRRDDPAKAALTPMLRAVAFGAFGLTRSGGYYAAAGDGAFTKPGMRFIRLYFVK